MTMTDREIADLVKDLKLPHPNDVKEFQNFLSGGQTYHLASVYRFVNGWEKDVSE